MVQQRPAVPVKAESAVHSSPVETAGPAETGEKRRLNSGAVPPRQRRRTQATDSEARAHCDAQDFSIALLRGALDAERERRRLSWAAATRQINRQDQGCVWKHPIAVSSVSKIGQNKSGMAEGDGVLQMLLWLNRSPESFVLPKVKAAGSAMYALPTPVGNQILRWDTAALHAALDRKRAEMGVSWSDVASAIGDDCTAGGLMRLSKGGRTCFPPVMRLVLWVGRPAAEFTSFERRRLP